MGRPLRKVDKIVRAVSWYRPTGAATLVAMGGMERRFAGAAGQEPVGTLIRRARDRLGYSQYEIAAELARVSGNGSLTREEVARWERGRRIPGPYWRQWLSDVLGVPPGDLVAAARVSRASRAAA